MKKITLYLFAVAVAISFTSCNKSIKSRLPGSWTITSQSVSVVQTIGGMTFPTTANTTGGNYTFKSDGTGTTNNNSNGINTSFTWTSTENTITFTDNEGTYTFNVVTNEKKKEKWTFDYTINFTDPLMGQVSQKVSGTVEVAKQ